MENNLLKDYLKYHNCIDCVVAEWCQEFFFCPILKKNFQDDGKIRTIKRKDCPIKEYRIKGIN